MGLYHIFLYIFRARNAEPLYFGIYCLLWMAFFLTNNANGWPARMFMGDIPAWMVNRIDLICVVISVPVIYSFLRTLYPAEFSLRLQQGTWIAAGLFLVPGLFASTMTFTSVISFYWVFCILLIGYMLIMLGRAIRSKREGAPYIVVGFSFLGIVAVNDMLYDLQVIRSVYLMEAGMLGFILFQACALSLRYARAFSSVEQLSGQLADKNAVLEREIVERARLEREIVHTTEEERRRISRELHDGLCQKLTGARLHFSVCGEASSPQRTSRRRGTGPRLVIARGVGQSGLCSVARSVAGGIRSKGDPPVAGRADPASCRVQRHCH